ncbi:hypothetical protein HMPREF9944_00927 [Segatella maculosa OT 289]|uniref:Uncharacterized protein n=1 Tax=Segatella maculosa OT 289 TaxID=999422 RepID=H1HL83_9BACT|nr:hypothetical protein HMPREF9944_00927 [Segatella maculosa OT 289]
MDVQSKPWCFSWCQTPPRFCTSIWKEPDECSLFLFLMSSMEDKSYFLFLLSSSMEEKRCLLKNPSSSMEDEHYFYIFLFPPWRKTLSVKISFVIHGRRAFFLHFLASPAGDEHSFFVLLSSPAGEEHSFYILLSSAAAEDRLFSVFCSSEASESLPFS